MLKSPDFDDARMAVMLELAKERSRGLRHRRRLRRCISGSAALVLAAGLAGGFALARSSGLPAGSQIQTAAYVTRVEHALAVSGQDSTVGYARTVLPPGSAVLLTVGEVSEGPGVSSSLTAGSTVTWSYQGTSKTSGFTATGQRVFDEVDSIAGSGGAHETTVIYRDATWWRAATGAPPAPPAPSAPPRCGGPGVDIGSGGWPAFIRYELGCGGYTADGRQRVDGIDAIKLTGGGGSVLWVNPVTYLPVRAVIAGRQPVQTDFRWLSPTPANLAQLSVPIPAGFRQVSPPS